MNVVGKLLKDVIYADDYDVVAGMEEDLQKLMNGLFTRNSNDIQ